MHFLTSRRIGRAFLILLVPGIALKRWLALGAFGALCIALGIIFALKISLWPGFTSLAEIISLRGEPSIVRAGVFIGAGIVIAGASFIYLTRSLTTLQVRRRHWRLLDSLYIERVLGAGPKVVVIGGGSGLPNLLRGLKHYTGNITAVVTVADDGGSSGRLRTELGILPPGDIRNCLVALADSEDVMQRLMDYRFSSNGQLDGHSFGNMFIAALAGIGGGFYQGVEIAGELLAIRGRVIPSTSVDVTLVARTVSGQQLIGESRVGTADDPLQSLALLPADAAAHPDAKRAIEEADMILLGPGSLFTSIVPNLLVPEIASAISNTAALKLYVCNVAGEPGQTMDFSVLDHLEVIRHYLGPSSVNLVLANDNFVPQSGVGGNSLEGAVPAKLIEVTQPWRDTTVCVLADVIDAGNPTRHDPAKLATVIAETYRDYRGRRRRLPRRWLGFGDSL
ncbi:MAG: hypothetical protein BZY80_01020 [SAR202 cluster bacterium Io17-Chloro-G2]|nr:MAG: hypothetical protein BZY80_01020 [SAR202 cluster bacterium Io17-Chloro-G2]